MHLRVTEVARHRLVAMLPLYGSQLVGCLIQGLIPWHGLPPRRSTPQGLSQSVRIFMDIFECQRFRANMAPTEGVLPIAPNRDHSRPFEVHLDAAHRLTQMATAVMNL